MTDKEQEKEQQRISKRAFLAHVAGRSQIPVKTVNRVYDTILDELMDIMRRGDQLMLTGFGKFYPQAHKGHRVQFADGGSEAIDDYFVLKFSATRSVNKALAEEPSDSEPYLAEDAVEGDSDHAETDADQDALFDAKPAKKARTSSKSPSKRKAAPAPATAAMAAAATQSSRAINRAKRQTVGQVVKGFPSDRAI
jgi:nucleoid DNA-binding protein